MFQLGEQFLHQLHPLRVTVFSLHLLVEQLEQALRRQAGRVLHRLGEGRRIGCLKPQSQGMRVDLSQAVDGTQHRTVRNQLGKDIVVAGKGRVAQLVAAAGDDPQVALGPEREQADRKLPLLSKLDKGHRFFVAGFIHCIFERRAAVAHLGTACGLRAVQMTQCDIVKDFGRA